jgi:hypothetical protein
MTDAPVILPTITAFPGNISYVFEEALKRNQYVGPVVSRPIRQDDANMTAAVHVDAWEPDGPEPYEIGQEEPTLQRYPFVIEYMVRFIGDVAEGRNVHSRASKSIRAMLYRDPELVLQLRRLNETVDGTVERAKRMVITRQRFFSNRMRSDMVFLSVIQGYVQTELQRL